MKISKILQAINLYPIPAATVEAIMVECGLDPEEEYSSDTIKSKEYKLAKGGVYAYLAEAPSVSEAGATYSFSEDERKHFRQLAIQYKTEAGDDATDSVECGYFGEDF